MIAFLTLFLGLVTGVQPVELTVTDPQVARVELRLDGRTVGVLGGAPWRLPCDFGAALAPHELVAVGFNSAGVPVGEARQWINMPRQRAEMDIVLEQGADGVARAARLVWSSVDVARPDQVTITFNGLELSGANPERFDLPDYEPTVPNLLQARLQLGETDIQAQVVVGGGPGMEAAGELTAVPLYLPEGQALPTATEMDGWLEHHGAPLRVVAVEQGGADVVLIQDLDWWFQGRLNRLWQETLSVRANARERPTGLKYRDRFRLLVPIPTATAAATRSLHFPMSPDLWSGRQGGAAAPDATHRQAVEALPQGLLRGIQGNTETRFDTSNQQLADAVAVGALAVAQGQRARVLILLTGSEEADHSRYTPEEVRAYLAQLNVPLRVWSPAPNKVPPGWGEVETIPNRGRLFRAIRELRDFLDRQVVVWVEGRYLPRHVALTSAAAGRLRPLVEVGPPSPPGAGFDEASTVADLPGNAAPPIGSSPTESTDPAPSAPSAPSAPPAIVVATPSSGVETTPFSDTIEVNLINIDVVVTDKQGRRVRGLSRDDFTLLEDGKAVRLSHFEAPVPDSRGETLPGPTIDPNAGPTLATAPDPMNLVLFLDLSNLGLAQRASAFRALRETLEKETGPLRLMVMTYDRRTAQIPLAFTADRQAVLATLEAIAAQDLTVYPNAFLPLHNQVGEIAREVARANSTTDEDRRAASVNAALTPLQYLAPTLRNTADERKREVVALVDLLGRVSTSLGGMDGRKALLYVGDRLSLVPGQSVFHEALRLLEDPLVADALDDANLLLSSQFHADLNSLNISRDFETILGGANAAGVTFYTLAPPNLAAASTIERTSAGMAGFQGRVPSALNEEVKTAACMMSGETGGLCQIGGTEITLLLDAALEDFDAFYTLAFTPDRVPDGKLHRIKVELKDRKLKARYRELYLDNPRADQAHRRLIAALTFEEQHDPLGVELHFGPQEPMEDSELYLVPLELRVSTEHLALLPEPDGATRRGQVRLLLLSTDGQGRTTEIQEYPLTLRVPEAHFEAGKKPPLFAQKVHLRLAQGQQSVAIGLWDEVGRVGSFVTEAVVVGAPEPISAKAEGGAR